MIKDGEFPADEKNFPEAIDALAFLQNLWCSVKRASCKDLQAFVKLQTMSIGFSSDGRDTHSPCCSGTTYLEAYGIP